MIRCRFDNATCLSRWAEVSVSQQCLSSVEPDHDAIGVEFGSLVEGAKGFVILKVIEQRDGLIEVVLGFGYGSDYG